MFNALTDRLIATIISIGSLFFPFLESIEPNFSNIQFNTVGSAVVLSMHLDNCYTDQLNQVISSGKTVKIFFQSELFRTKAKNPDHTQNFYHTVRYNLLENQYEVYFSETDRRRLFSDISLVHKYFTSVSNYQVLKSEDLKSGQDYYIRLTAYLENITFIGEDSDLDLMLFWNNKKPSVDTEVFNSSIFLH